MRKSQSFSFVFHFEFFQEFFFSQKLCFSPQYSHLQTFHSSPSEEHHELPVIRRGHDLHREAELWTSCWKLLFSLYWQDTDGDSQLDLPASRGSSASRWWRNHHPIDQPCCSGRPSAASGPKVSLLTQSFLNYFNCEAEVAAMIMKVEWKRFLQGKKYLLSPNVSCVCLVLKKLLLLGFILINFFIGNTTNFLSGKSMVSMEYISLYI